MVTKCHPDGKSHWIPAAVDSTRVAYNPCLVCNDLLRGSLSTDILYKIRNPIHLDYLCMTIKLATCNRTTLNIIWVPIWFGSDRPVVFAASVLSWFTWECTNNHLAKDVNHAVASACGWIVFSGRYLWISGACASSLRATICPHLDSCVWVWICGIVPLQARRILLFEASCVQLFHSNCGGHTCHDYRNQLKSCQFTHRILLMPAEGQNETTNLTETNYRDSCDRHSRTLKCTGTVTVCSSSATVIIVE